MANHFKHKTQIQIRFKDIDALGHVNNANHLSYIELARVNYFNSAVGKNINWSEEGIILARIEMDYLFPVLPEDEIWVYTRCSKMGNKSFDLEYLIIKKQNNTETQLAKGKSIMVCYNYKTKNTISLPTEWKEKMLAYENT
jgi:acyl-CoA thioester hydrolase